MTATGHRDLIAVLDLAAELAAVQTLRDIADRLVMVAGVVGAHCVIYHHEVSLTGHRRQVDIGWAEGGFTADRLMAYSAMTDDRTLIDDPAVVTPSTRLDAVCESDAAEQRARRPSTTSLQSQESPHPLGCDDQIAFVVQARHDSSSIVTLGRGGRPFDERERWLVALIRPHLTAAIRRAQRTSSTCPAIEVVPHVHEILVRTPAPSDAARRAGLTGREVEVLRALHSGTRVGDAARQLGITPATLSTHLAAAYRKLGVTSRHEAVAMVFPSVSDERRDTAG